MTLSERNKVISSGPLVREERSPQKHEAHGEKLVSGASLTLQCLLCDRLWEEDEQISCRVQANTCVPHSKWPASGIREEFSKLHSTKKKKNPVRTWAKDTKRHFREKDIQGANERM